MADKKIILVTGATGHQGGAVARNLFGTRFQVRALTRDPDQKAARELRDKGAEVVKGTFDDAASLEKAMDGAYGVFSVQNFWEVGYDKEVEQGIRVADTAVRAGVEHFVYSSVGSADQDTGIPHFDSKYEIEQHLHTLDLPTTIIRPVFFMNNWESDMMKNMVLDGTVAQPLSPDTRLQQIEVNDIGVFAALAFQKPMSGSGGSSTSPATSRPCRKWPPRSLTRWAGRSRTIRFRGMISERRPATNMPTCTDGSRMSDTTPTSKPSASSMRG